GRHQCLTVGGGGDAAPGGARNGVSGCPGGAAIGRGVDGRALNQGDEFCAVSGGGEARPTQGEVARCPGGAGIGGSVDRPGTEPRYQFGSIGGGGQAAPIIGGRAGRGPLLGQGGVNGVGEKKQEGGWAHCLEKHFHTSKVAGAFPRAASLTPEMATAPGCVVF